jgi:hypothetical protein
MDEVGLFTVSNGKIIKEEFFYTRSNGGMCGSPPPLR